MKTLHADQLVTATGGAAAAANLGSWIKPLPAALGSAKPSWNLWPTPLAQGSTSWLGR